MKKRGQILGLPLILVFGMIVGAFILLYGAKVILDLSDEANYVDFLDQIQDFDTNIQIFEQYDVGSSKVYTFSLSKDVETLCFYVPAQSTDCTLNGEDCSADIDGELEIVLDDEYNFYVFPQGVFERTRFTITPFSVDGGNPVCVSNGNSVVLQSQKEGVLISYYETL